MIMKNQIVAAWIALAPAWGVAAAHAPGAQGAAPIHPVEIARVRILPGFWATKLETWRTVTLDDCFTKFEKDQGGAINNFDRVRDGLTGKHAGPPWYDGLIYEMIRAASDFLASHPDPALEARLDGYISRIAAAQARGGDGYLNTYTQLEKPDQRFGLNGGNDTWQHDLYNLGALVEAGVHHHRATGKTALLEVALRMTNHVCDTVGWKPRREAIPGHAIAEQALVRLYHYCRAHPELAQKVAVPIRPEDYLALAEYFLECRGRPRETPSTGAYNQDHLPVADQRTAEGHAVRATLTYAGMVALDQAKNLPAYRAACNAIWNNMVERRMHITGSVGAFADQERFGTDYQLPNDAYLETCAAVGAGFFHEEMLNATGDARYADELERVLYNGALVGISLEGTHYFYENPLTSPRPRRRWEWHSCPCCPPMFLKIYSALPGYLYATSQDHVYVHQYVPSEAEIPLPGGRSLTLRQETDYPWDGRVSLTLNPAGPTPCELRLRIPAWCQGKQAGSDLYRVRGKPEQGGYTLAVNGQPVEHQPLVNGYAALRRTWNPGDVVELVLDMTPRRVTAHPAVKPNEGRVAVTRGPILDALELPGVDSLENLYLPPDAALTPVRRPELLGGVVALQTTLRARTRTGADTVREEEVPVELIPYYAQANREPSLMAVWLAETPTLAQPKPLAEAPGVTAAGDAPRGLPQD